MPWIYAIAGLLVGIAVGMLIARLTTPQYKTQKNLQKELESFALDMSTISQSLAMAERMSDVSFIGLD